MLTVKNLLSARSNRPVSNQFHIVETFDTTGEVLRETFQSYESMIACIDYEHKTLVIGEDWDYSVTTGKYRNQFFNSVYGFRALSDKKELVAAMKNGAYHGYKIVCCA